MKKTFSFLLLSVLAGATLFARQIDLPTAQKVAENFAISKTGVAAPTKLQYALSTTTGNGIAINAYYIFSLDNVPGFIVVAADDVAQPILAYSFRNNFQTGVGASPETQYWMRLYEDQIVYMIDNGITTTADITQKWQALNGNGNSWASKPTGGVEPMLTTTWDQGIYYDLYTPGSGSTKTPVGCVATAMAQIMKYWNYPATGTGSYSYSDANYGALSADFGATHYQWSVMPDNVSRNSFTASKEAVSELGYHCGIAVQMSYAPAGSGSQVIAWYSGAKSAETAFKENFGYKSSIQGLRRDGYSENTWLNLLKAEIDAGRPILYAGFGVSGGQNMGHAFIFDGYDENNMFHVNWGWGSNSDGYFTINNLQPSALGIGAGSGNFNYNQQALIKIEPAGIAPTPLKSMALSLQQLDISRQTINRGDSFSVTATITNISDLDYEGGFYRAEIYREDSTYVTFFSRFNNQTLPVDSVKTVSFTSTGITSLTPGLYYIRISYMDLNAEWAPLTGIDGAENQIELLVTGEPATSIADNLENGAISIYPNPAISRLWIDFSGLTGKVTGIQVYNIQGQQLIAELEVTTGSVVSIPVSQLPSGVYYVRVVTDNKGVITRKVVISH